MYTSARKEKALKTNNGNEGSTCIRPSKEVFFHENGDYFCVWKRCTFSSQSSRKREEEGGGRGKQSKAALACKAWQRQLRQARLANCY